MDNNPIGLNDPFGDETPKEGDVQDAGNGQFAVKRGDGYWDVHSEGEIVQASEDELSDYLADGDLILDGGACTVGVESTIIDCTGVFPKILRPGAITEEMIRDTTNLSVEKPGGNIRVSGSLEKHYSPRAKVILDIEPKAGDGFIAISGIETPDGVIRLAAPRDDEDFARLLYSALRKADDSSLARVIVQQPVGGGIAIAIRDRLLRASRGR
mgnify:CR=1 FL=1